MSLKKARSLGHDVVPKFNAKDTALTPNHLEAFFEILFPCVQLWPDKVPGLDLLAAAWLHAHKTVGIFDTSIGLERSALKIAAATKKMLQYGRGLKRHWGSSKNNGLVDALKKEMRIKEQPKTLARILQYGGYDKACHIFLKFNSNDGSHRLRHFVCNCTGPIS